MWAESLHQTAFSTWQCQKNSIFSPSAKVKICTLQGSTPSLTKQVKTLWMDLFWNHFNSSLRGKTHIDLKSSNLPFKKNSTHHHSNPAHLQARQLCPLTYSLSLPLEWSQVTHIPTSIKWVGPTSPKSHLCQTIGWHQSSRWLSTFPAHS